MVGVPTHGVPHVDVALVSPVVALRKGLPVGEHVAFLNVWTLSKAVIIQPGRPVVHVARTDLPVGCSEGRREKDKRFQSFHFPLFHSLTCIFIRQLVSM